jgi:hypothetical protein
MQIMTEMENILNELSNHELKLFEIREYGERRESGSYGIAD